MPVCPERGRALIVQVTINAPPCQLSARGNGETIKEVYYYYECACVGEKSGLRVQTVDLAFDVSKNPSINVYARARLRRHALCPRVHARDVLDLSTVGTERGGIVYESHGK